MNLNFEKIKGNSPLTKQHAYLSILSACPQIASDYSFVNLWGWADVYGLEWAWDNNLVWIRQSRPEEVYWAPVGAWHKADWGIIGEDLFNRGARFIRVPEQLVSLWRQHSKLQFDAVEARSHWDYIYSVQELIGLKGKRFHKKKNLLNQFKKKYDYKYIPAGPYLLEQARSLQTDWCEWRDCEASVPLEAENRVIEKILTYWARLSGLLGGGIEVDGRLVAYTVAEALSNDTAVIHFEKANPEFKGAYQAINQLFLLHIGDTFHAVNREQDLGDPGLRKAKLSYNPFKYLRKYTVKGIKS